jgi:hypothetical protein
MRGTDREYVDIVLYTVPLRICGIYYPGSPQVMYYSDMSGHPGDPEEFEILGIWCDGTDIMELLVQTDLMDEIEAEVLKNREE